MRNALVSVSAPALIRARATDAMATFDQRQVDSTGAFLVGELERLDPKLNLPLVSVTWSRDIDLREDVSMGDEQSSFTLSSFAANGGLTPGGKAWLSTTANQPAGVSLDIGKTVNPITPWAVELKWTLMELASAEQVGRPIDVQKYDAMMTKWSMDTDQQVYIGDTDMGHTGLFNSALVTPSNVVNGASASPLWTSKTADEILKDVNDILNAAWLSSAYARCPTKLLLSPIKFSYIASQKVSANADKTILEFLRANSICNSVNGKPLDIQPVKWATGNGAGSTDRMVAYSQEKDLVRFPRVNLQRTPVENKSLFQSVTYYGKLGVVEVVYPETIAYRDGY